MPPMAFKDLLEQIDLLSREERQRIVDHIQSADDTEEAAWEDQALTGVLGNGVKDDGSIDFDQLYASDRFVDGQALHSDYPDLIDKEGHINPSSEYDV